eukprot:jgi/Tetstr1/421369/TSEL_012338.t1
MSAARDSRSIWDGAAGRAACLLAAFCLGLLEIRNSAEFWTILQSTGRYSWLLAIRPLITKDGSYGMLKTWVDSVKKAGVTNYMVVCLDDEVMAAMKALKVPFWRKDPVKGADRQASNHGISALKFQLLKEFLVLGYSVLLSDVDIVTLKDPFPHLHRDHDIEALSDGFDPRTAYGWDDVFDDPQMGWSRYAHTVRTFMLNSGLFFIRPSTRTVLLMDRLTERLAREKVWDQQAFNEAIFFPSALDYISPHVTVRIMDIYKFVNSKTLFKVMRYHLQMRSIVPVMVHVNYHPDKWDRMKAVIRRKPAEGRAPACTTAGSLARRAPSRELHTAPPSRF